MLYLSNAPLMCNWHIHYCPYYENNDVLWFDTSYVRISFFFVKIYKNLWHLEIKLIVHFELLLAIKIIVHPFTKNSL